MQDNAIVSAIITTKNRKELLKYAINSVRRQTYQHIECIVVDDSGTDGTKEYISEIINDYAIRYIYIPQSESRGGNHARNVGIRASHGEYIAFLDDDDEWMPTKIEKQVKAMEDPEVGFVYCGAIRETNMDPSTRYSFPMDEKRCIDGDISKEILIRITTTTTTMMIRRSVLDEVGFFDEDLKFWQEYELSIRVLQKTKAICIRENLILYRIIEGDKNRLSNKIAGWEEAVKYIEEKHKNLILTLSPEEEALRQVYICIDGFGRGKKAGSYKTMMKYATKVLVNKRMRRIAINKYMHKAKPIELQNDYIKS